MYTTALIVALVGVLRFIVDQLDEIVKTSKPGVAILGCFCLGFLVYLFILLCGIARFLNEQIPALTWGP